MIDMFHDNINERRLSNFFFKMISANTISEMFLL